MNEGCRGGGASFSKKEQLQNIEKKNEQDCAESWFGYKKAY